MCHAKTGKMVDYGFWVLAKSLSLDLQEIRWLPRVLSFTQKVNLLDGNFPTKIRIRQKRNLFPLNYQGTFLFLIGANSNNPDDWDVYLQNETRY